MALRSRSLGGERPVRSRERASAFSVVSSVFLIGMPDSSSSCASIASGSCPQHALRQSTAIPGIAVMGLEQTGLGRRGTEGQRIV
eukprot:2274467-Rhodomonas_salina.2